MIIIEHIAIWVNDVEKMKSFYQTYFGAKAGSPYMNKAKQFQSCFLEFGTNARIELMHRPDVADKEQDMQQEHSGYAHIALSIGSEQAVDAVTTRLMSDGYHKLDGPAGPVTVIMKVYFSILKIIVLKSRYNYEYKITKR